jgi:hypothetical protein
MAKDILKEAIADAKAVREVALANAKAALEEAFTPKLQNMLSAKLSEDLDEEYYDEDEAEMDMEDMDMDMDNMDEMGDMSYDEDEDMELGEEDSMDEEINLEDLLNELEAEEDSEEEEVEEAVGKPNHRAEYVRDVRHKADDVHAGLSDKVMYEGDDEEFDLNALLNEINNLEEEKEEKEDVEEVKTESTKEEKEDDETVKESKDSCRVLRLKLNESQAAYKAIKSELNEVNLLNSKLLYVNRIFKANQLDDGQKLRVVETLDKADSVKEAKLIYETIKDTFNVAKSKKASVKTKTRTIKENFGMASKAAGTSTAPKKAIIAESSDMVSRFQKLANIQINE